VGVEFRHGDFESINLAYTQIVLSDSVVSFKNVEDGFIQGQNMR
jgi:hypothetical protein